MARETATVEKKAKARFKMIGRKDGLVDQVVQAIEAQILSGRLTVGSRLPAERDFSERLGMSRPVVREAVRILTTRGLLDTRHGIGTTVRAVSRDEIVNPSHCFFAPGARRSASNICTRSARSWKWRTPDWPRRTGS